MSYVTEVKCLATLRQAMYEVVHGTPLGVKVGCVSLTKKRAKELGILWSIVESYAADFGLIVERHGKDGFIIYKPLTLK